MHYRIWIIWKLKLKASGLSGLHSTHWKIPPTDAWIQLLCLYLPKICWSWCKDGQRWRACCRHENDAPRGWSLALVKHFVYGHASSIPFLLGAHRWMSYTWLRLPWQVPPRPGESRTGGLSLCAGQVTTGVGPTTDGMGRKRGSIIEPIPSPDDKELCDRLCFNMSVVGTNKPRCPGHGDKAGEKWGVRGHWQTAFIGSTGLSWHSWGPRCQPGHESRPCPLCFPQREALRNRTWISMCVYKMLLVASNDRQISSPLSTVPHYIIPCISDQGSSASCESCFKRTFFWLFPEDYRCSPISFSCCCWAPSCALIMPSSFQWLPLSYWCTQHSVCHLNIVTISLEPLGGVLAFSASVSRPSSSP